MQKLLVAGHGMMQHSMVMSSTHTCVLCMVYWLGMWK
jgi:hypothetical protein